MGVAFRVCRTKYQTLVPGRFHHQIWLLSIHISFDKWSESHESDLMTLLLVAVKLIVKESVQRLIFGETFVIMSMELEFCCALL